jgi:hypothetical protein
MHHEINVDSVAQILLQDGIWHDVVEGSFRIRPYTFTSDRSEDVAREVLAQGHAVYRAHIGGPGFTFDERQEDGRALAVSGSISSILAVRHEAG